MNPLIGKLAKIQKEQCLSDEQVANRLGVKRPMWTMLRNGKLQPGRKTLTGIMRGFPELTTDVLFFLQSGIGKTAQKVS